MALLSNPSIHLSIPCNTKHVAMVRKCIRIIAESQGFNEVECQDIEVAVAEAVTNSVVHGRPESPSAMVSVRCSAKRGTITIEVEDEGNSQCVPSGQYLPADTEEHGRGTVMIRRLMDEVSTQCTGKGLLVTMSKRTRTYRKRAPSPSSSRKMRMVGVGG